MQKLTSNDIINYLKNGATLTKVYAVYSYWTLNTIDGKSIYNFRKGSPELAKSKIQYEIIKQDKTGYTIKIK